MERFVSPFSALPVMVWHCSMELVQGSILTSPTGRDQLSGALSLRAVGPPSPGPRAGWPGEGCGRSAGAETV